MQEEMALHLAFAEERFMSGGMSGKEARKAARREFGNLPHLQEEGRDARGLRWFESLVQDVTFALRTFRKTPLTTATIILLLGLGLGANTALFTFVHSVMTLPAPGIPRDNRLVRIRPYLEIPSPEESYRISGRIPGRRVRTMTYLELQDYAERTDIFSAVAGWQEGRGTLIHSQSEPRESPVVIQYVTNNYFPVLGVRLALGDGFPPPLGDASSTPHLMAVMDHDLWEQEFGRSPEVIGNTLNINGSPVEIVGVAPPRFSGVDAERGNTPSPANHRLWIPLNSMPVLAGSDTRAPASYDGPGLSGTVARLSPGVTLDMAGDAVLPIAERAASRIMPPPTGAAASDVVRLTARNAFANLEADEPVRDLLPLYAIILLVLAILCANVGVLLTGSAADRRREVVVRLATGASRSRIVRQLLTESALRAWLGGVLGVFIVWMLFPLGRIIAPDITIAPSWEVTFIVFGLALVVGLLLGLLPALHATRATISESLKSASGTLVGRQSRLLRSFVVLQIALSQPLLVALIAFSISGTSWLRSASPSEIDDHVFLTRIDMSNASILSDEAARGEALDRIRDRLIEAPGVVAAARQSSGRYMLKLSVHPADRVANVSPDTAVDIVLEPAMPGYLDAMNLRITLGRDLLPEESETLFGISSLLLSDETARRFWGQENPIGRRLVAVGSPERADSRELTVVGVVDESQAASKQYELGGRIYAYAPFDIFDSQLLVRVATPGVALTPLVQRLARDETSETLPVTTHSIREIIAEENRNVALALVGLFAAVLLGLTLSAIGLYAAASASVRHRAGEIGLRSTLGASPAKIRRSFLLEGLRLGLLGVAIGLPFGLISLRIVASTPGSEILGWSQLPAGVVAAATLIATTLLASWIPARRAAAVDPMTVLRAE